MREFFVSAFVLAALAFASVSNAQTTERVRLPDDSKKLYVSLYVEDAAQAKELLANFPELQRYRKGNHFKVYTKSDPMLTSRFKNVADALPVGYVQRPDRSLVYTTSSASQILPWRRSVEKRLERQKAPVDESDDENIEEDNEAIDEDGEDLTPQPPIDEGPNYGFLALTAILGIAVGVGIKYVKEKKASG